jgi:hypothetical protein
MEDLKRLPDGAAAPSPKPTIRGVASMKGVRPPPARLTDPGGGYYRYLPVERGVFHPVEYRCYRFSKKCKLLKHKRKSAPHLAQMSGLALVG